MSNQVFQQNLDDKKGPQPGGPYLIQMLFKEPVEMHSYWVIALGLAYILFYAAIGSKNVNTDIPTDDYEA